MGEYQIRCVKPARSTHEAIQFIGGVNADGTRWKLSVDDAIDRYLARGDQFFVDEGYGRVYVQRWPDKNGRHLRTAANGQWQDNLTRLPECP